MRRIFLRSLVSLETDRPLVRFRLRDLAIHKGCCCHLVCCLLLPFSATPQASFTLTTHYLPSFLQLFWLDMALLEWVIWCTSLLIGITCFKRSIFSLKSAITASAKDDSLALDLSWYFWWHTLWHVSLPIGAALWSFARHSRLFPGAVAGVWIGTG